jgi:putative glycerol-1-phosphate prenyltransferase
LIFKIKSFTQGCLDFIIKVKIEPISLFLKSCSGQKNNLKTMKKIYQNLLKSKETKQKLLAVLLDPDKIDLVNIELLIKKIHQSPASHIFIGGSTIENNIIDELIIKIRQTSKFLELVPLPIILFPGNPSQISAHADGILFLSLISGRNSDFLIEHQVNSVSSLKQMNLEVISTGYILIESGTETAVERVSKTKPLNRNNIEYVVQTAQAGEMLGNKLIYLEAGSGAKHSVPIQMIEKVAENIKIPLIVGGGIVNWNGIQDAYDSGADLVVIGTAFENNINFFDENI